LIKELITFGGINEDNEIINDLKIYDLKNKKIKKIKYNENQPKKRYFHSSCIHNNLLYIYGGISEQIGLENANHLQDLWKFDINNNMWSLVNKENLPGKLRSHSMINFNQFFYIFGGFNGNDYSNETYKYDIILNKWEKINLENKPHKRRYFKYFI
jgi:N-acetylneuraminic acid mutarotase